MTTTTGAGSYRRFSVEGAPARFPIAVERGAAPRRSPQAAPALPLPIGLLLFASSQALPVRLRAAKAGSNGLLPIALERLSIDPISTTKVPLLQQEVKKRNQAVLYVLKDDAVKGVGDVEEIADPAKVAGYLMYSWTPLAASITKLAVKEICRRQGFGEALIRAAIQQIRDRRLQCVNLHVEPSRSAAVALYKKKGFFLETTVKSYDDTMMQTEMLIEWCFN